MRPPVEGRLFVDPVEQFRFEVLCRPSAPRLHFWRSADDIVLSRVVLHDDFTP